MLAHGLCSGQNLLGVLRDIEKALPPNPMGKAASALASDIDAGRSLSQAMKALPDVFSQAHVSLIEGGERLGVIDRVTLLILEFTWRRPTCGNLRLPTAQSD